MKHLFALAMLSGMLLFGSLTAEAGVYTFQPVPADMYDFDHYYAYEWGLAWTHPDEVITGASLKIKNIYDWAVESNDIIRIHMIDDPVRIGVKVYGDYEYGTDYFASRGPLVGTWTDPAGGVPTGFDLIFDFNSDLIASMNSFVLDGNVGFGFDPDCHYYNDGVELTVTTATTSIPEPTTMILFGLGLTGLGYLRRK